MSRAIFTIGPRKAAEGAPTSLTAVVGVPVAEVVLSRSDIAGALLSLADGRYAITGRLVAVGSARQLKRYASRRLRQEPSEVERAWYEEVIGRLARRSSRPFPTPRFLMAGRAAGRPDEPR
jgi:potassium/hydrogen antiporter